MDDGWSGTNFARPAFTEIMELAEAGQIGTLIVKAANVSLTIENLTITELD